MLLSSRRILQIAVAIGGLVPVGAGLAGVFLGPAMTGDTSVVTVSSDSHFRYLSGLLLGIGLGFWSTIPDIEKQAALFRALTVIVFVGGLSRLYGLITVGIPDTSMLFGLGMELVVTPLLALGQNLVARQKTDEK